MKILFYNWIQFDNKRNIGGGVNVYQRNIIDYFVKHTTNDIFFLSSGWKYNPFKRESYIKETSNMYAPRCRSFEIINSTIMAPSFTMFMNPKKYLDDMDCYRQFEQFIETYGPFDVIHFNNIEGISINVLKLKEKYPSTKFVVSIHNYQTICPLVQYFNNQKSEICNDYCEGLECLNCAKSFPSKKEYYRHCKNYLKEEFSDNKIQFLTLKFLSKLFKYRNSKIIGSKNNMNPQDYELYREKNIELLNKYCDSILAVSDRVRSIMLSHGIIEDKIKTSYIGTEFANHEIRHSVSELNQPFTIAYLGYERIDKGFFFLIKSLEKLDKETAGKINLVLAVKDLHIKNIKNLSNLNRIKTYNGYTHKDLPKILSNVNLGIIPVLWEDNLPQVAIEMVACGVPILCSDFGGASELCKSGLFRFKGGDEEEFLSKLKYFLSNPKSLNEYWENHNGLTTMEKHSEELLSVYCSP